MTQVSSLVKILLDVAFAPRYTSTGQCVICQEGHYRKNTKHRPRPSKKEYLDKARKLAIDRGGKCFSKEYIIEDLLEIVKKRGGEVVSFIDDYRGLKSRIRIKCSNGHTWSVTVSSILHAKSWCPKCLDPTGEQITRKIFEAIPCILAERVEAYATANNSTINSVVIEALDLFLREQKNMIA